MRGRPLLAFAAFAGLIAACGDDPTEPTATTFTATMTGASEVPPVQSSGTGTFNATLQNNVLTYSFTFSGLASNSNASHIHGPATTAQAVAPIVDFNAASAGRNITLGATSGSASGTIDMAPTAVITATINGDSLRKLLDLGLLYVNVHSVNLPAGEVRGQIIK